ncbi:MAG: tetratricopeptide repeat protein [Chloroflexi bacterium]|nr:tetratricopeptide repeat protein [Chloroflexota bacterium]
MLLSAVAMAYIGSPEEESSDASSEDTAVDPQRIPGPEDEEVASPPRPEPSAAAAESAAAQNSQGREHLRTENYEAALAAFNRAIELDPDYVFAYRNRAAVYRRLGRSAEAEADEEVWRNPPQLVEQRES